MHGSEEKTDDKFVLSDVNDLLGLICTAHFKIKTDDQYGDSNEVSYFKEGDAFSEPPKIDANEKLPFE